MAILDEKIEALRAKRADFNDEVAWHKFLLDAAYGIGGFRGRVGPTAISHLGWAADAYSQVTSALSMARVSRLDGRETYLDQFAREDDEKFSRRIDVSHYTNYVGPIHDILMSFINKSPMNRDHVPDDLLTWMETAGGDGSSWETLQSELIRPRASLLGWCPVVFDFPELGEADPRPLSKARARSLGKRPRVTVLFPVNILDWIADDDGIVSGVKICTRHEHRPSGLLGKRVTEERYVLWYPDRVERYTVEIASEGGADRITFEDSREHGLGRVPLVIFRAKATPDDKVRGISSVANSAVAARRLFNLESEMDDHIRGQVFAVMGVPVQDSTVNIGEIVAGNGNAIMVPMLAHQGLHFAAPPASVAETLEKRMEVMVREIYRTEHIEHVKATGTQATSGVARAYEFEQTNRRLSGMAASFARSEEAALRLVGQMLSATGADTVTVTAPDDFSVEDLTAEIEAVLQALGLDLGPTAETEMRRRLIRRIVPNLPVSVRERIDEELDEQQKQREQDQAFDHELRRAGLDGGGRRNNAGGNGPPGGEEGQAA